MLSRGTSAHGRCIHYALTRLTQDSAPDVALQLHFLATVPAMSQNSAAELQSLSPAHPVAALYVARAAPPDVPEVLQRSNCPAGITAVLVLEPNPQSAPIALLHSPSAEHSMPGRLPALPAVLLAMSCCTCWHRLLLRPLDRHLVENAKPTTSELIASCCAAIADCHSDRHDRQRAQGVRLHVYASRHVSSPPEQLHTFVAGLDASVAVSQKRSALPQSLLLKQRPVVGAAEVKRHTAAFSQCYRYNLHHLSKYACAFLGRCAKRTQWKSTVYNQRLPEVSQACL